MPYAMYTLDMSIAALQELISKLQQWVEENTDPDEDGSGTFAYVSRILFPGPEVRTPSVKVIIRNHQDDQEDHRTGEQ